MGLLPLRGRAGTSGPLLRICARLGAPMLASCTRVHPALYRTIDLAIGGCSLPRRRRAVRERAVVVAGVAADGWQVS